MSMSSGDVADQPAEAPVSPPCTQHGPVAGAASTSHAAAASSPQLVAPEPLISMPGALAGPAVTPAPPPSLPPPPPPGSPAALRPPPPPLSSGAGAIPALLQSHLGGSPCLLPSCRLTPPGMISYSANHGHLPPAGGAAAPTGEGGAPSHGPELQRDHGLKVPSDTAGSSAMWTGQSADVHLTSTSMWMGQATDGDHICVVTRREPAAPPSLITSASSQAPEPPIGELASSASPSATPSPPPPPDGSVTPLPLSLSSSGGGAVPPPLLVLPASSPQQPERGSSTLAPRPMQVMRMGMGY